METTTRIKSVEWLMHKLELSEINGTYLIEYNGTPISYSRELSFILSLFDKYLKNLQ